MSKQDVSEHACMGNKCAACDEERREILEENELLRQQLGKALSGKPYTVDCVTEAKMTGKGCPLCTLQKENERLRGQLKAEKSAHRDLLRTWQDLDVEHTRIVEQGTALRRERDEARQMHEDAYNDFTEADCSLRKLKQRAERLERELRTIKELAWSKEGINGSEGDMNRVLVRMRATLQESADD